MNKKWLRWLAVGSAALGGVVVVVIAGYVVWLSFPQRATVGELQRASEVTGVTVRETDKSVVITPAEPKAGLLVYPGARVESKAYAYKMSAVAEKGVAVVIAKPLLHFALLDVNNPDAYKKELPSVSKWFVGGHSLGGVKACAVAEAEPMQYAGVVLLGSYCSVNISQSGITALSIGGANDKLTLPAEIAANKLLLPADATFVMIAGMNHASFGDYGAQDGDGTMTANNEQVRAEIASAIAKFSGVE